MFFLGERVASQCVVAVPRIASLAFGSSGEVVVVEVIDAIDAFLHCIDVASSTTSCEGCFFVLRCQAHGGTVVCSTGTAWMCLAPCSDTTTTIITIIIIITTHCRLRPYTPP